MQKYSNNIRNLIFGIITVICLDIGFNIYMGADHPTETASLALHNDADRSTSTDAATPYDVPATTGGDNAGSIDRDDQKIDLARSVGPGRQKSNAETSFRKWEVGRRLALRLETRQPVSSDAIFRPVVIRYRKADGTTLSHFTSEAPNFSKKDGPASDNRSLIAKALPILKKPYDWLKALGSKLK